MGIMLRVHRAVPSEGLGEMTRRKREIVGLTNERDFPHVVELALPPGGFRSVFLEFDAFHRERRIPVRRGRSRHEAEQSYIRFCFPDTATADAPQSLRWRVLDLRTGEAQAADLGYVVGCTVVTREAEEDWRKEKWRQRRARAHLCLAWSYWPLC